MKLGRLAASNFANCGQVEQDERLVCSLQGSRPYQRRQNKKTAQGGLFILVPVVGLEPTRYRYQRILSRIRRLELASIFWKQIECYAQINTMKSDFSRFCAKKSGRITESIFLCIRRKCQKKAADCGAISAIGRYCAMTANMYRAATNVNDAQKALKIQACPGIGHVRVAPPLL